MERNADNHRRRSPIKNVCSRPINFFSSCRHGGTQCRKSNKRFVHSFIHSFIHIGSGSATLQADKAHHSHQHRQSKHPVLPAVLSCSPPRVEDASPELVCSRSPSPGFRVPFARSSRQFRGVHTAKKISLKT